MFSNKYITITNLINSISNSESKLKLIEKIDTIDENMCNVLFIHDYQITCKIDVYYLNTDVPISRNSNTTIIKDVYASYIYYLVLHILNCCKYNQYYTMGEFVISFDMIYDLVIELNTIITGFLKNSNVDPIDDIKQLFNELLGDKFDENKYTYLLDETELVKNNDSESELNITSKDVTISDDNSQLEQISDTYTEQYNSDIYVFDDGVDNNFSESDEDVDDSEKTHKILNNIKANLVNILENKN
jgi:hypothetical protein